MSTVGPFETILLVAALAVTGTMTAYLPRTWREFRWARRFGDEDERRIGKGMWLGHLATIACGLAFVVWSIRLLMLDRDSVRHPVLVYLSIAFAFVCCALLLVSQMHYVRRRPPRSKGNVYTLPTRTRTSQT